AGGGEDGGGESEGESEGEAEQGPAPEDVSVEILNNAGVDGLALEVQAVLAGEGYTVTGTGNPVARFPEATTVYHAPGEEAAAEMLAGSMESAVTEEAEGLAQTLELVLAPDWAGFADGSSSAPEVSVTDDLGGITAEETESAC
ncbi:LytR C-terminal domain-containing protein, partial [Nocardiopsis tropica]|nr:LytR C-terminal domain-containing protein [Nocardiopsis tropica]